MLLSSDLAPWHTDGYIDGHRRCALGKQYSISDARDHLARVVHEAEDGVRVQLTRRGQPVAVILSIGEYERLTSQTGSFWEAYEAFRARHDLSALQIDPDEVFGAARDPALGRDFTW